LRESERSAYRCGQPRAVNIRVLGKSFCLPVLFIPLLYYFVPVLGQKKNFALSIFL